MQPSEFWDSDPPETIMFLRAYVWNVDQRRREMVRLAWQTAGLYRAKQFPTNVTKLLGPELDESNRPRRRRQYATPKLEWAMWEAFAARVNARQTQKELMTAHES
jgi:hypothetical protein